MSGGKMLLARVPGSRRSAEPCPLAHNHPRDASSARPRQAPEALADSVSCGFNPDMRGISYRIRPSEDINYAKGLIRLPSLLKNLRR